MKIPAALKRIVAQPDLLSLGVKRQGNHIDNSKYLYYDGQLVITLDEFPKGKRIPPHDHGVWEALAVYKGSFEHTVYELMLVILALQLLPMVAFSPLAAPSHHSA